MAVSKKPHLDSHPSDTVREVDFFQLVRAIERETGGRIGSDAMPDQEPIVLKADPDAHFPATEVVRWNQSDKPEILVSFFGLFGPSGALPQHYTQLINDRSRLRDFSLREFLDLFNHRLLSFFYRCWEKHQFPIAFETASSAGIEDCTTGLQRALIGMRTPGLWDRQSFPSSDSLYFVGHLSNRRPTACALQSMIASAFDVPVTVEQLVGQLMLISPQEQTRMGSQPLGFSIGNQLGTEAFAGERVWDFQNKIRLRLGPLTFDRFQQFSPNGRKLRQLFDTLRLYLGPQYDVDVQVVLRREEVKPAILNDPQRAGLGWNTWLGNWPFPFDAQEAVFQLTDFPT